jgi:hypothetical protein
VRRLIPFLALAAVLAGCGHGKAAGLKASALPKLVLQPADAPGLDRFDFGRITRFDAPEGPRSDLGRFGRVDGWKADYKTAGGSNAAQALVVHSQVDLFGSGGGARQDLRAYTNQFQAARDGSPRSVHVFEPRLGDDASGMELQQGGKPALRVYTVAWVDGRVSASVTINGFGAASRTVVLRFARKEERRIAAALAASSD